MNSEVKATLDTFLSFLKASDLKKTGDSIVRAFEMGVRSLVAIKNDVLAAQKKNDQLIADSLVEADNRINARLANIKDGKTPTKAELLALITPLIPQVEDGETPTEEQLTTLISTILDRKEAEEDAAEAEITGDQIVSLIEALPEGNRLAIKDVDGLAELFKKMSDRITFQLAGGAPEKGYSMASQAGRDIFTDIDLSPQFDGVTKTFQIPAVYNIISVVIQSMPNTLRKNIDFTYTPTTITFAAGIDASTQLAAGQNCTITAVKA